MRNLIIFAAIAILTVACSPQVNVQMIEKPATVQQPVKTSGSVVVFQKADAVTRPYRTIAKLRVEAEVRSKAKSSGFIEDLSKSAKEVGADAIIITNSGEDSYVHTFRAMGSTDQITIKKDFMEADGIVFADK